MVYLFKPVLISFFHMIGFFPRSIFNKYTVINFKWCLGRRLMSILPHMAKSQMSINSVAPEIQTWLYNVSGLLPWFPFLVLAPFPLSHCLHLCTNRSCTTIYRGCFPQLQVIPCLRASPSMKEKSCHSGQHSEVYKGYSHIFTTQSLPRQGKEETSAEWKEGCAKNQR